MSLFFFEAIKPKEGENDRGQNAEELCERFNVEWDTVKNFRRHDRFETDGVVRSKMDKVTRTIYVYRDPSKTFYGKTDMNYCPELDEVPDDFTPTPDFSSSDK